MHAKRFPFLTFLALSLAAGACGGGTEEVASEEEPAGPRQVELNTDFQLAASQTAEIAGEDLQVTFVAAMDDSRCPIGVRCVWAGQVSALIRLERNESPASEVKLTRQPGQSEPSKELVDAYEVLLTEIEPYPEEGKEIQPADYIAHLIVRKPG